MEPPPPPPPLKATPDSEPFYVESGGGKVTPVTRGGSASRSGVTLTVIPTAGPKGPPKRASLNDNAGLSPGELVRAAHQQEAMARSHLELRESVLAA